jgi:hypothetical protein
MYSVGMGIHARAKKGIPGSSQSSGVPVFLYKFKISEKYLGIDSIFVFE